jgi:hypothetical protein
MSGLDLGDYRQFLHTPKEGNQPNENQDFFTSNYENNAFIRTFMKTVDHQFKQWAADQSPKVAKVFNSEFMKYLTDASPMRTARKVFLTSKRHEKQILGQTPQPASEA